MRNKECRDEKHHVFASCTVLARLRKQLSRYFILYVKIPEFPIVFFSFPLQLLYHSCDYMVDTLQYVFDEYRKSGFILNVQRTRRNTWNAERWNVKLDYDKILAYINI